MRKAISDAEIMDRYEAAIDKEAIVDALAAQCRLDRVRMREKLRELGLAVEEPPPLAIPKKGRTREKPAQPKKTFGEKKIDDARAMELYREGKTDSEIGKEFGVTAVAICLWRKKEDLPANGEYPGKRKKRGGSMKKKLEEAAEELRAERELQESAEEPELTTGRDEPCEPCTEPARESCADCQNAGSVRVPSDTEVRVAENGGGMTADKLAEIFLGLRSQRNVRVRVGSDTEVREIRGVSVALHYDSESRRWPSEVSVMLEC